MRSIFDRGWVLGACVFMWLVLSSAGCNVQTADDLYPGGHASALTHDGFGVSDSGR